MTSVFDFFLDFCQNGRDRALQKILRGPLKTCTRATGRTPLVYKDEFIVKNYRTLEKLPLIVKSVRESSARKRKSDLVLGKSCIGFATEVIDYKRKFFDADGLAAKRRSTRNKAFARKSLAKVCLAAS